MTAIRLNKAAVPSAGGQLNETIKKKAQELYEKSGKKSGRDLENWLEAERIVKSQSCR